MMKRIEYDTLVKCVNWEKQKYYLGEATKSLLSGISDNFLLIPDEDYEEAMQALAASRRAEERLFDTARRNNDGMRFEKRGDIDAAIDVYEESIDAGYPALHSFDRLMKLYRRRKDYLNEIRVIKWAVDVFSAENTRRAEHAIEAEPSKKNEITTALLSYEKVMGSHGVYCFIPYDIGLLHNRLHKAEFLLSKNI